MSRRLLIAGLVLGSVATARAHLVTTGLGPVYDGISHLFVTLDDLLAAVAMALVAGLNGAATGRRVLLVLPLAWLAGGAAGFVGGAPLPGTIPPLSLLALGALAAADVRLAPPLVMALAALLGLAAGWSNGASIAGAGREAGGLAGIAGAVFVLTALVAAGVVSIDRPPLRIAVRVAGSWIAAIGLLLLGWTLRGRA